MIKREKDGVVWFEFENLAAAGVRHCFSSRIGGVSLGGYSSLNLGLHNGDDKRNVRENFARLCASVGLDGEGVVFSNQVHGVHVEEVSAAFGGMGKVEVDTDGLMTGKRGVGLATYYADCVPLLFFDPIKGVAANSHAGWRGVACNIAAETVRAMKARYNSCPKDILVGIGPSICPKCFEVDEDVAENFQKNLPFSEKFVYNSQSVQNKFYIDLAQVCVESLLRANVPRGNIEAANICTFENDELFFSHRRTNVPRGNMLAVIQMR